MDQLVFKGRFNWNIPVLEIQGKEYLVTSSTSPAAF